MLRVAIQMLTGDLAKYLGLVLGIAFSTLLISQQSAIFHGAMTQTTSLMVDTPDADVWVMRRTIDTPEDHDPMPESFVKRVGSVDGVAWAVPLYKGTGTLRTDDARRRTVMLVGVDDATLIGAPPRMVMGSIDHLRGNNAVILDIAAYHKIFPGRPVELGGSFEIGRHRAVVVGVCRASPPFHGMDVAYTRRSVAVRMTQEADRTVSFVLARASPGVTPPALAARIREQTGLLAHGRDEFNRATIDWYLEHSGITEVLGTAILLGLVVGVVIVGQTFYMFSIENIRQFATLKAIGLSNLRVLGMLAAQAVVVAGIGYGLGIGMTSLFFKFMTNDTSPLRGMTLPVSVMMLSGLLVLGMTLSAALFSARRILAVDPAIVFKN